MHQIAPRSFGIGELARVAGDFRGFVLTKVAAGSLLCLALQETKI